MTISHLQNQKDLVAAINTALGAGGGGGGPAAWGSITGTLSSQTDLQTALNGKAASTHGHAISDVTGLQTALDGKAITKSATISIPNGRGVLQHRATVTDAAIALTSKVMVSLAGGSDADENDAETLDIMGLSAIPADGSMVVIMAFGTRTAGPVKIHYTIG